MTDEIDRALPTDPLSIRRAPPTASLGSAILASLPWVYALLIVVSYMPATLGEFDDPIPLILGALVQQGATPTIDYRAFYPPLAAYVTAGTFNLFGRTVIATRLLDGAIYLLVLFLLGRLLARHFPRFSTRVSMTLLLLAAVLVRVISIPPWQGFGLAAVALLVYFLSREGCAFPRLTLGLSGVLTGLAMLYRVNFGGYVALVVAADLIIEHWPADRIGLRNGRWKQALLTGAGFFVPMLACVFLICLGVYGSRLIDGIREFTVTSQQLMFHYRFYDLNLSLRLAGELLFPMIWFSLRLLSCTGKLSWKFLPGFALGLGVLILTAVYGHHASVVGILVLFQIAGVIVLHFFVLPLPRLERAFLFLYVLQLHYYLSRADAPHMKFLPFLAALLFALLWLERAPARGLANIFLFKGLELAGLGALLWIVFGPDSTLSLSTLRDGMNLIADVSLHRGVADSDRVVGSAAPGAAWESVYSDADEMQALRHLRQLTTSAEPIFAGVRDHSTIYISNLQPYWLSGRPIGVREFQLEDMIASEAPAQREIIRDLDQNHVNWAFIDLKQLKGDRSITRHAHAGSKLLDAFILEHFREESRFGRYALFRRAPGTLP